MGPLTSNITVATPGKDLVYSSIRSECSQKRVLSYSAKGKFIFAGDRIRTYSCTTSTWNLMRSNDTSVGFED